MTGFRKGVLYAAFAYICWGFLPLYWHLLSFTSPLHILGCRIVFSLVFTVLPLIAIKNKTWIQLLSKNGKSTVAASLALAFNWGLYIWAVNTGHTMDASLGYYMNPLVSILLGLIFLKEKLTPLQWTAFGLAVFGVILKTLFSGVFPVMAVLLALSFGFYGLLKKKNKAGSMESLGAETLAALPIGLAFLLLPPSDIPQLISLSPLRWILLASCGIITAVPLLAFSQGAKFLPLATVGFLQFINPTILFFLGVFVFGETFSIRDLWAFIFIWAAMILYCLSLNPSHSGKCLPLNGNHLE
ncbi:EamA family transporter RarD [Leadbettera azotonutricia]|uniref:EamA family transporter RarD n=1 Tax=Leadbettera azotonutricia TaxID=150829 RepID=UPI0005C580D8|nr:EamA family transporter RarD [Leadbettera azotonutricia]